MSQSRPLFSWVWPLLVCIALLWPARIIGSLDGLPLESTIANAVLVGVVFPSLLWVHPQFLRSTAARAAIVALIGWKAICAAFVTTDGWCVRFEPQRPLVKDATSIVPHSWDVRADWLSDQPACSAIVRRAYKGLGEFPVWFFNLPPPNDSWPNELDLPPRATTGMIVSGFIDAAQAGTLQLDFTRDMHAAAFVDGAKMEGAASLAEGIHHVRVEAMLTGDRWRFEPRWNGADLWHSRGVIATLKRPSRFDEVARRAGWLGTFLAVGLLVAWAVSLLVRIGSPVVLAWSAGTAIVFALLAATNHIDAARWCVGGLALAAFIPVPTRLRNVLGAFALVGIPWLTLIVVGKADNIAHFRLYAWGNDYWMYQRFGYRIVMQGYWLEGGTKQFYFQPLYRWVSGLLHLLFGESSIGEFFWEGACYLVMALLAFQLAKAASGFRMGLIAAATTLTVIAWGLGWGLIGGSLSEITSAGFISLGAFMALRSRRGSLGWAVAAGILASLGFYTRLNNLPMAAGITLFALSARKSLRDLVATGRHALTSVTSAARALSMPTIRASVSFRTLVVVPAVLLLGLAFFAWRNWHFNGSFSVFGGTQLSIMVFWQPGTTFRTLLARWADSVAMVLTVHDPPEFDWKSLPVLFGALVAPLAVVGVPRFRDVPALPALFFLMAISAAFVARGFAYPGRFSVHIIGVTCALAVIGIDRLIWPRQTSSGK